MRALSLKTLILSAMALLVASCSSTQVDELGHTDGVGYIGDYSKFEKVETDTGLKKFRYVGEELKSGSYHKVIIGPVDFYPKAETSEQVHSPLLEEIKTYLDRELAAAISPHFEVVDVPEAGALEVTARVTAIRTVAGDIELKEVVPVGAVLALAKAASGYRHQDVEVFMEIKLTDSLSGKLIGGSVKQGKGAGLSGANEEVEFEDVKPLLDIWVGDVKTSFERLSAVIEKVQ